MWRYLDTHLQAIGLVQSLAAIIYECRTVKQVAVVVDRELQRKRLQPIP